MSKDALLEVLAKAWGEGGDMRKALTTQAAGVTASSSSGIVEVASKHS
jgi:hypothetical protein